MPVALPIFRAEFPEQAQGDTLAFDVASVRRNLAGENGQGADKPRMNFPIGSDDAYYNTGGVFSATNLPLISYLIFAYKITNNNRQALIDSAPPWVNSEFYNIEARTDRKSVTKDEMRQMMQSLLKERFHLYAHTESRETRVYAAELDHPGKLGIQLRPHPIDTPCQREGGDNEDTKRFTPSFDPQGFPLVCGRFVNAIKTLQAHHRRIGGGDLAMSQILSSFTGVGNLGHPVVDRTGLAGKYDFVLDFLPDPPPGSEEPADASGPRFVAAVRSQLGLKLIADKASIDFVILDHIEHPTPN
ncbi:TIGR03435 family protein [Terriglobus sp. RCC_193]|uniref:TIGR03435 family protein n=1 Tax=Terriglobus sp. RCC_193 TaxID=3239218 RepID=UPI0035253957